MKEMYETGLADAWFHVLVVVLECQHRLSYTEIDTARPSAK